MIGLLDNVREAQGVRIFIGAETRAVLAGRVPPVIAAPYMTGRHSRVSAPSA
jgi:heat-inducible transcriptional repressor